MSSLSDPNWLGVAAAFFMISGLGILARAFLVGKAPADSPEARDADSRRGVNLWIGGPLLASGFFMQAVSQVGQFPPSVFITVAMLTLAIGLMLYLCLEDTLADLYQDRVAEKPVRPARLALLPPVATAETTDLIEARRLEIANQL